MRDIRTGETPIQYADRLELELEEARRIAGDRNAWVMRTRRVERKTVELQKQNERLKQALREYGRAENWVPRISGVRAPKWSPGGRLGTPAWEDPTHIANLALGRRPDE